LFYQSGDQDDLPSDVTGLELGERRSNVVERVAALDRDDEVWPSVGSVVWLCGHAPAGRQVRLWCGLRREPMLAIKDSKHGVLLQ
jgi:hypothetical protein